MTKEKFLLVSLSEPKAKELAQAVSNETCRKILEYLADNEATESQLAKILNLPISTVHYNLNLLQQAGLIIADEYHYSPKGKEVNHYKLANKYIIIAPKSTYGIKERLKSILPVAFILAAGSFAVKLISGLSLKSSQFASTAAPELLRTVNEETPIILETAGDSAVLLADTAAKTANAGEISLSECANGLCNVISSDSIIFFLAGAAIALGLYLLIDYLRNK